MFYFVYLMMSMIIVAIASYSVGYIRGKREGEE